MDRFRFDPELLEHRSRAIAELEKAGYQLLSHYRSVDTIQDLYGLEVCGIQDGETARAIFDILHKTFPEWPYGGHGEVDWDGGWQAAVCRDDPRHEVESWSSGADAPNSSTTSVTKKPGQDASTHPPKARILVAVGDAEKSRTICGSLGAKGHQILEAGTSDRAIQLLRSMRPQIIITDVFSPPVRASEIIRCAKQIDPSIPVLATKSSLPLTLELETLAIGAAGFLCSGEDPLNKMIDETGASIPSQYQGGLEEAVKRTYPKERSRYGELLLDYLVEVQSRSRGPWTPLHTAAVWGHVEHAETLLANGAAVDAPADVGMTPLVYAVRNNHSAMVQLLLAHGANIHQRDGFGRAVLHHAALFSKPEMIELLVANGADVNALCHLGRRPMDCALTVCNDKAIWLLSRLAAVLGIGREEEWLEEWRSSGRAGLCCGQPTDRPPRILVVEDEWEVMRILSELLQNFGYEVAIGGPSDHAVSVLPVVQPDLVTTDLANPPLGGRAVIQAVKKYNPNIPVVVIAGFTWGSSQVAELEEAGAISFLPKPFGVGKLEAIIEHALMGIGNLHEPSYSGILMQQFTPDPP